MDLEYQERIGRGLFGEVWRAKDRIGRMVAVKFFHNAGSREEQYALEHARALSRVRHDSVVQVFAVDPQPHPEEDGTRTAIVMEYVGGTPLGEISSVAIDDLRVIGLDSIRALAAIHNSGIVHGDLHKENVIWTGSRVVLIDMLYTRSLAEIGTHLADADKNDDILDLVRLLHLAISKCPDAGALTAQIAPLLTIPPTTLIELEDSWRAIFERTGSEAHRGVPDERDRKLRAESTSELKSFNRVLLPVGIEMLFFAITDSVASGEQLRFAFDAKGIQHLALEFIAHGAIEVATSASSPFAMAHDSISAPLRRRIMILDARQTVIKKSTALFEPVAHDLGIRATMLELLHDPIAGPQRHVLQLDGDKKRSFADALVAYNFTYQILLAMEHQLQVDIPLHVFRAIVQRLESKVKSTEARTNLAFLRSLLGCYKDELLPALQPAENVVNANIALSFHDFLEDESLRQYSELKHALGFPQRAGESLRHLWTHTTRMLRRSPLRELLGIGLRLGAISAGALPPTHDATDGLLQEAYLPPIVNTATALTEAYGKWLKDHPEWTPMEFSYDEMPSLAERLRPRLTAEVRADAKWLVGMYGWSSTPPQVDHRVRRYLESFWATNLAPPYFCPQHLAQLGIDAVSINWGEDIIAFMISTCCEQAARHAWAQMCAYDKTKNYRNIGEE